MMILFFGWRRRRTWAGSPVSRERTPSPTCGCSSPGVPISSCDRWTCTGRRWSGTCGGCRRSVGSSRRRCRGGWPWSPASTAPVSSTPCSSTHPPTTSGCPPVPAESPTLGLSHRQFEALLTAARDSTNVFDFALVSTRRVTGPVLLNRRGRRMDRYCATRRLRAVAAVSVVRLPRMHPHMLRHTYVTTMLDAGVDLRDVQLAARHADPRTTMRYDRARTNLDRHPNYILAAYMASGTSYTVMPTSGRPGFGWTPNRPTPSPPPNCPCGGSAGTAAQLVGRRNRPAAKWW
jgi:hypothetical protein